VIPERRGVLILDGTSFPKQGPHSVGAIRQYCGALGKLANCQVATTVALWTGVRGWFLGAQLYLPEEWLTPEQRARARIPAGVVFQEKWRQALTLLRQVRAAGFAITAVLGDAEFGDVTALRATLHRLRLPYALGISSNLVVFRRRPRQRPPRPLRGAGRPRTRPRLLDGSRAVAVRAVARGLPAAAWHSISWRNGSQPRRRARFAAVRVTPAHAWRQGQLAPEVWLLCEDEAGRAERIKCYFVHLPPHASLRALVALAHQRWAIEQQYQELKSELGLDHFEGRTYPGWQHHVVLTAVAHAYIQRERMRRGSAGLTFPAVRAIVQEIFTALLFAEKPRYLHWMEQAKHKLQLRI
jgi:SRSO17 transposase